MTEHMHDNARSYVGSLKAVLDKVDWAAVDRIADLLFNLWQDDRQPRQHQSEPTLVQRS